MGTTTMTESSESDSDLYDLRHRLRECTARVRLAQLRAEDNFLTEQLNPDKDQLIDQNPPEDKVTLPFGEKMPPNYEKDLQYQNQQQELAELQRQSLKLKMQEKTDLRAVERIQLIIDQNNRAQPAMNALEHINMLDNIENVQNSEDNDNLDNLDILDKIDVLSSQIKSQVTVTDDLLPKKEDKDSNKLNLNDL